MTQPLAAHNGFVNLTLSASAGDQRAKHTVTVVMYIGISSIATYQSALLTQLHLQQYCCPSLFLKLAPELPANTGRNQDVFSV